MWHGALVQPPCKGVDYNVPQRVVDWAWYSNVYRKQIRPGRRSGSVGMTFSTRPRLSIVGLWNELRVYEYRKASTPVNRTNLEADSKLVSDVGGNVLNIS